MKEQKKMQIVVPSELRYHDHKHNSHREVINHIDRFNEEIGDLEYAVSELVQGFQKLVRLHIEQIKAVEVGKLELQKEIAKREYKIKSYQEFIDSMKMTT